VGVDVDRGFRGEVADLYHKYRHGYPPAVIGALAGAFGLTGQDVVVDLGCGTGQLTLPMARRVRAVVGVDPEPDMLRRAQRAAREAVVPLVRAGGGIAAVTNGTPLWFQDTDWSRALRGFLERWLDTKVTYRCGTDERAAFAEQVRAALAPHDHFTEHVHVAILAGQVQASWAAMASARGRIGQFAGLSVPDPGAAPKSDSNTIAMSLPAWLI